MAWKGWREKTNVNVRKEETTHLNAVSATSLNFALTSYPNSESISRTGIDLARNHLCTIFTSTERLRSRGYWAVFEVVLVNSDQEDLAKVIGRRVRYLD